MATKDNLQLSLGQSDHANVNSVSNQNGQYSNLNLNANQTSPILETIQSKSISSTFHKKNHYAATNVPESIETGKNVSHNKLSSWNSNGGGIWSNGSNMLGLSEDKNPCQKGDKNLIKNNSTLSLHISAYENSIEAPVGLNSIENDEIGSKQKRFNKTSKNVKTFSPSILLGCFEIPRQQSEGAPTSEPEIMQFKASQKLLNPNMPSTSSTIKIHMKVFVREPCDSSTIYDSFSFELEKQTSLEQLISLAFDKVKFSREKFEIKSFLVLNKKSSEYISVSENYILQPFDKFQLYLAQKEQQSSKITVTESGTEERQTLSFGTSKVESIKDLSSHLHEKLDVKEGKIKIEKFDEDFDENVGVEDGEKFDSTKKYNIHITKITKFDVVVEPDLTVATKSNSEDKKSAFDADIAATSPSVNEKPTEQPSNITNYESVMKDTTDVPEKVLHLSAEGTKEIPALEKPVPPSTITTAMSEKLILDRKKIAQAALIEEYEKKLEEFFTVPENMETLLNKNYSRELILLVQEIDKNFHIVPCPMSEAELKRIGIDLSTMPAALPVKNKPTYNARGRGGGARGGGNNIASSNNFERYSGVGSARQSSLSNAINGAQQNHESHSFRSAASPSIILKHAVKESVEVKLDRLKMEFNVLLDKLTASNFKDVSTEIIKRCNWNDVDALLTFIDLIFVKAINEPNLAGIYAALCLEIHKAERSVEKENIKYHFHGGIIRKIQKNLEATALPEYPEPVTKLQKQIFEEQKKFEKDEKKLAAWYNELEDINQEEKFRMHGILRFIGRLFNAGLYNFRIVENCIVILLRNVERTGSELILENAITFMKEVGPFVSRKKEDIWKLDGYVSYLDKFKATVSSAVKSMIVDLMEFRDKKWVEIFVNNC